MASLSELRALSLKAKGKQSTTHKREDGASIVIPGIAAAQTPESRAELAQTIGVTLTIADVTETKEKSVHDSTTAAAVVLGIYNAEPANGSPKKTK